MPKILVDNSKAKKQYKTYAVKTCPVCGSVIEVSEQEAISFPTLENNNKRRYHFRPLKITPLSVNVLAEIGSFFINTLVVKNIPQTIMLNV